MAELTKRAIRIFEIIKLVDIGVISVDEASEKLCRSERTIYRHLKKLRNGGIGGLNHQGHEPWNRTDPKTERQILELKQERPGRSAPLICHIMKQRHKKAVHQSSVKRAIQRSGIDFKRPVIKEPIKPYEMKKFGHMWQMDTFERKCVPGMRKVYIVLIIDDYSRGILAGRGFRRDSTPSNMLLLRMTMEGYGVPHSIKVDNDTKFTVLRKRKSQTQLVRACRELDCVMFPHKAYNAKSKGKVERRIPFLDEWFIKENEFTSLEDFNEKLRKFIAWFNTEFKVSSTGVEPVKRMAPSSTRSVPKDIDLDDVFCEKVERKVRRDCTISYKSRKYLVGRKYIGEKVDLHIVHYKGIVRIWWKKRFIKSMKLQLDHNRLLTF